MTMGCSLCPVRLTEGTISDGRSRQLQRRRYYRNLCESSPRERVSLASSMSEERADSPKTIDVDTPLHVEPLREAHGILKGREG
jgi:hypothetical protein